MSSSLGTKITVVNEKLSSNSSTVFSLCRALLFTGAILYLGAILILTYQPNSCTTHSNLEVKKLQTNSTVSPQTNSTVSPQTNSTVSPTNVSHLLFLLMGSEKAVHHRKAYTESWWRPGETKGYLYLDKKPTGDLLPWSRNSPPYRVSEDISKLMEEIKPRDPIMHRMNHGILEMFREHKEEFRWLVLGDDDSIFFVDNMVDVLQKYDHTKYYYIGAQSEFIMENFLFSFYQGFGGGGLILSYPLAKAFAYDMENCIRRSPHLVSSDQIAMACIGDIGVSLTQVKGFNQVDLRGDLSGFLSSHPKALIASLHHFDLVEPIYPKMDRFQAARHMMAAAKFDQSRMFQQTVCHQRKKGWTFSTSWGYSVHLYEKILPRWWLQYPIETFLPWLPMVTVPPIYMFNTRRPFGDPCEAPHVFFMQSIKKISDNVIRTSYVRSAPRLLPPCMINGNQTADYVLKVHVDSPATKRIEIERCECCDVHFTEGAKEVLITYRECMMNEVIA